MLKKTKSRETWTKLLMNSVEQLLAELKLYELKLK